MDLDTVSVTLPRSAWQTAYTVCLSEATRAIKAADALDLDHVLQILPTISEAAASPELEALEGEVRSEAERRGLDWI